MYWSPKTQLGIMVEKGEITSMEDALKTRLPLREPEIIDILLPDLVDEVLDVNMVQRMTDSGRRVRFAVTTVVGNSNGYVGLGKAKGKEVGPTIRKAIDNAKLNIIEVRRGCGSWECGCGKPHSFPFEVTGKMGSVRVTFKPAPRGIALAVGDVAKPVLKLAGIEDAWAFTKGHTKTTANYATAAFEALKRTSEMRVSYQLEEKMMIHTGMIHQQPSEEPQDEIQEVKPPVKPNEIKKVDAPTDKPEPKKEETKDAPKEQKEQKKGDVEGKK
jgi:small subunit ribosomal protein S5